MAKALTVAIAGAGLMGSWHARYARQCGASICGIVDPDIEAARRLASQFSGVREFAEVGQLLGEHQPHVVHICTPAKTHVAIVEAALESGAHVLAEKPLAPDAAVTRDLLSLANRKGRLLSPVHQFPFQKGFQKAQDAIPRLGRIVFVDAVFCSAGGASAKASLDEIAAEILPHPLSLIERLAPGSLDKVDWNVDTPFSGEWRVSSRGYGFSISILISLHARPTEASLRIGTEGGVVDLDLFHGFATIDAAPVSKSAKLARPFRRSVQQFGTAGWNLAGRLATREFAYPGLRNLFSNFYDAVRKGGVAPISAAEVLSVAAARDRILQPAARQQNRGRV